MTKFTLASTDPDNPDDERIVEAIGLELPSDETPALPAGLMRAIEAAAEQQTGAPFKGQAHAEAQAFIDREQKRIAQQVREQYGLSVGGGSAWAYKPKPKQAYNLWKRAISLFNDMPRSLDWSVVELADRFDENEPNFTVTRDMMYDQLNAIAVRDLKRALDKMGVQFELKQPVSIASIRKQFIERRDALLGAGEDQFNGTFAVRGDRFWINDKSYAIQRAPNGARRIRHGKNGWLNVEALKDFCTR